MGIESTLTTPLAAAVRRAGSQSAYARLVGVGQSTVYERLAKNVPISAEEAILVERGLGISRHLSRPDLFGTESFPDELERLARDVSSAAPDPVR